MQIIPAPLERLIVELEKLPGIGPKSASRLAFYLIKSPPAELESFGTALLDLKGAIRYCEECFNFSSGSRCPICEADRDDAQICVVEEPLDLVALEKTHAFKGRYHVLHGAIAPIEGIGPDQLKINELLQRIDRGGVTEVILAMNPTLTGEATAMYLHKLLADKVKVSRLASGLPMGGNLEYADELTLSRALAGRTEF